MLSFQITIFKAGNHFSFSMFRNLLLALIVLPFFFSCKSKKISLNENPNPGISDFIDAFPTVSLPYEMFFVNNKTFTKFFPDSVLTRHFGKTSKPKIYLLGKSQAGKNEYYLFFNAINSEKRIAFLSCFTKEKKFSAARVLFAQQDEGYHAIAALDAKYTVIITHQHKNSAGELLYKKDDYIYNDAGKFMFILTESNDPTQKNQAVIDPIDTLPHKRALSGDYLQDKRNFISIRDLKDASRFIFFIHFEKDNGDCKGELKGTAKFSNAYTAQYHSGNNDPCGIQFSFKDNAVFIKETSACGSHRDIKCLFEGSYKKKKELKKKLSKKSK
jgi:hypothetical protein